MHNSHIRECIDITRASRAPVCFIVVVYPEGAAFELMLHTVWYYISVQQACFWNIRRIVMMLFARFISLSTDVLTRILKILGFFSRLFDKWLLSLIFFFRLIQQFFFFFLNNRYVYTLVKANIALFLSTPNLSWYTFWCCAKIGCAELIISPLYMEGRMA